MTVRDEYYTPAEIAATLHVSVGVLRTWRAKKVGPSYAKWGQTVLYPVVPFDTWREAQVQHTREAPAGSGKYDPTGGVERVQ